VVSSKNLRAISAAFFSSEEMLCFSKSFLSRVLALMVVSNMMAWRSDSVGGIRGFSIKCSDSIVYYFDAFIVP
jgi:hypothetical protein